MSVRPLQFAFLLLLAGCGSAPVSNADSAESQDRKLSALGIIAGCAISAVTVALGMAAFRNWDEAKAREKARRAAEEAHATDSGATQFGARP